MQKHTIDAKGKAPGRVATEVAVLLMGKNRTDFARNAIPDIEVEVNNASGLKLDAKKLDAKQVIDHAALKAAGLARGGKDGVRLLAKGELKTKVSFKVAGASKGAVASVEKAGGTVEIVEVKAPSSKPSKTKAAAAEKKTPAKKAPAKKAAPKADDTADKE